MVVYSIWTEVELFVSYKEVYDIIGYAFHWIRSSLDTVTFFFGYALWCGLFAIGIRIHTLQ
jgi:hypothetical protein